MPQSVLLDKAAEILGVSRRTVYYRIRAGRLQTLRTRCGSQRVLLSSIEALMREERNLPSPAGAAPSAGDRAAADPRRLVSSFEDRDPADYGG